VHIEHTALIVENYDDAIRFFVDALGFGLVEDSPATTNDGRPKRWVVVRPPAAQTGLLLAEADGSRQVDAIGRQYAGRVGLFLRVDDFEASWRRMLDRGVEFVSGLATSSTAALPCSSTSQETDGTYSDRRVPESGLSLIAG
jgi:catechol 2,3-dioxygenase-like lactoylglutathione lyase family enzyme